MEQSGSAVLRIAVVDDHLLFRRGVIDVLRGWTTPHTVVEAENGVDYEARCREWGHVHLALVDLRMPLRDGYETLLWMKRHQPRTVAVAISYAPAPAEVMRALHCEAYAVLDKAALPPDLFRAMQCALRRDIFVNHLVTAELRRKHRTDADAPVARWASLSPREQAFVRCYTRTDVDTLVDVARRMGISLHTAETYRRNVYRKLDLHAKKDLMHFVLTNPLP